MSSCMEVAQVVFHQYGLSQWQVRQEIHSENKLQRNRSWKSSREFFTNNSLCKIHLYFCIARANLEGIKISRLLSGVAQVKQSLLIESSSSISSLLLGSCSLCLHIRHSRPHHPQRNHPSHDSATPDLSTWNHFKISILELVHPTLINLKEDFSWLNPKVRKKTEKEFQHMFSLRSSKKPEWGPKVFAHIQSVVSQAKHNKARWHFQFHLS